MVFGPRPIYEPNQLGNYIKEDEWNILFHKRKCDVTLRTDVDEVIKKTQGTIHDLEDDIFFLRKLVSDLKERKKFNINMNE